MSGGLYRDAHVGLRARIKELTARIETRESEVTEAFWDSLAPLLREQLGTLRRGPIFGPVMSAEDSLGDPTRYGSPTVEEAVVQGQLLALSRFDIPTQRYASSPPSASRDRR